MRLRECMFEGTPYGTSLVGKVEQVEGFTPEMLTAHHKKLLQSARIECFYVGSDDPAYVASLLQDMFAAAPASLLTLPQTQILMPREKVLKVTEDMFVAQVHGSVQLC